MKTSDQKLAEMEALSRQAADRVKSIILDPRNPYVEVKLLDINVKDKALHEMALDMGIYFALTYGVNLIKIGSLVTVKNPIAGLVLGGVGKVLNKLGKHYHQKQVKLF